MKKKNYQIKIMDAKEDITDQQSEYVQDESIAPRNGIQFESEVDSDYEDETNRASTNESDEDINQSIPSASSNNNSAASISFDKLCLSESLSSLSSTTPRPEIKHSLVRLPKLIFSINFFSP
jgi:hypothetical protein